VTRKCGAAGIVAWPNYGQLLALRFGHIRRWWFDLCCIATERPVPDSPPQPKQYSKINKNLAIL
jgi:hypothetical protein